MIVDAQLLGDYLDNVQPLFDGALGAVQRDAYDQRYPVIRQETARFLSVLLSVKRPLRVLEIGCAVGFSAGLFSKYLADGGHITTIDRYDYMIERANQNFTKMGIGDSVTLLEGDAAEILPTLREQFDFIFLDAAKGQYLQFLPHCLRLLKKGGLFIADDVLQGGTVALPREHVPRRQRTTHRRMRCFLWLLSNTKGLETSIVPVGDGLAVCHKKEENVILPAVNIDDF
jgi:predicted O-methyltransferase YrrM